MFHDCKKWIVYWRPREVTFVALEARGGFPELERNCWVWSDTFLSFNNNSKGNFKVEFNSIEKREGWIFLFDSKILLKDYFSVRVLDRVIPLFATTIFCFISFFLYCSMQILDKLGLGELYEEVERSIEKVVLPSYVEASTASSVASSGAAKNQVKPCLAVQTKNWKSLLCFYNNQQYQNGKFVHNL